MQMKDESDPILEVNAEPELDTNVYVQTTEKSRYSSKHRVRSAQDQVIMNLL